MRNFAIVSEVTPRPVRYSRARAASGRLEEALEVLGGGLVDVDELAAKTGLPSLFRRVELPLRQSDASLGGDDTDGLRKADVLQLHDKGEDITFFVTAEAVEVAMCRVDRERSGLLLVKRAKAGVVLSTGLT